MNVSLHEPLIEWARTGFSFQACGSHVIAGVSEAHENQILQYLLNINSIAIFGGLSCT